jgi:hypothetical protein
MESSRKGKTQGLQWDNVFVFARTTGSHRPGTCAVPWGGEEPPGPLVLHQARDIERVGVCMYGVCTCVCACMCGGAQWGRGGYGIHHWLQPPLLAVSLEQQPPRAGAATAPSSKHTHTWGRTLQTAHVLAVGGVEQVGQHEAQGRETLTGGGGVLPVGTRPHGGRHLPRLPMNVCASMSEGACVRESARGGGHRTGWCDQRGRAGVSWTYNATRGVLP